MDDVLGYYRAALFPATQINANNVRQLKTAWSFPILGGHSTLKPRRSSSMA